MSLETTIKVTCDYAQCKNNPSKTGPVVLQWSKELAESGLVPPPEESMYLVIFSLGGVVKTFCGQLHAAMYFMPLGYDVTRKKLETLPVVVTPDAIPQADGDDSEDVCSCGHPAEEHGRWGCCVVLSDKMGDFCKCKFQGPIL